MWGFCSFFWFMYFALPVQMIHGCFWPEKIIVSLFNMSTLFFYDCIMNILGIRVWGVTLHSEGKSCIGLGPNTLCHHFWGLMTWGKRFIRQFSKLMITMWKSSPGSYYRVVGRSTSQLRVGLRTFFSSDFSGLPWATMFTATLYQITVVGLP